LLYVLERINSKDFKKKQLISARLEELVRKKLGGINPCIRGVSGETIVWHQNGYWQLSPFIKGVSLKRPDYVHDIWRGEMLADFIIKLRGTTSQAFFFSKGTPFSLKNYIKKFFIDLRKLNPELENDLKPVLCYLDKAFLTTHDSLPLAFCHGDFHPLNVIWGKSCMEAVIDWEFSGIKPELYDAANLLGCLGIEKPEGLVGGFALGFINRLQEKEIFSDLSWKNLVPMVIALRFAWLSEWLRKKDAEMTDLEIYYMRVLIKNADYLEEVWKT
jgi:homoserine kinase type II